MNAFRASALEKHLRDHRVSHYCQVGTRGGRAQIGAGCARPPSILVHSDFAFAEAGGCPNAEIIRGLVARCPGGAPDRLAAESRTINPLHAQWTVRTVRGT